MLSCLQMNAIRSAAIIIALSVCTSVEAQTNVCLGLLSGGIFDQSAISDDEVTANYFKTRYYRDQSLKHSDQGSFALPIDDIPVKFGHQDNSTAEDNVCDDREGSSEAWRRFRAWSRRASPIIANAFIQCIQSINGFEFFTERSSVAPVFRLRVHMNFQVANMPPAQVSFSMLPADNVLVCEPKTVAQLKHGITVRNNETFDVQCEMASYLKGVSVAANATGVALSNPSADVLPFAPLPIFLDRVNLTTSNGVKAPVPGDAVYVWGSDTLLNAYHGDSISPYVGSYRTATWNLDRVTPGLYDVSITYANAGDSSRNLDLIAGANVLHMSTGTTTGGWSTDNRITIAPGSIRLSSPTTSILVRTSQPGASWPHVKEVRLVYVGN